ncbi:MAG: hypothetical protein EZS28_041210 [Streblomastix strix]|uniref:Uncharacterized protein n=1 Tax=Streblomastix strix TaxID=222440 RepID=A0A5J4TYB4_9EUKA|nr:MAG: hypothetical protein EZS28_041210 [Streblomastix strix]
MDESKLLAIRPLNKNCKKRQYRKHQWSVGQSLWTIVYVRETIFCLLLVGCLDLCFVFDGSGDLYGGPRQFILLNNGPK